MPPKAKRRGKAPLPSRAPVGARATLAPRPPVAARDPVANRAHVAARAPVAGKAPAAGRSTVVSRGRLVVRGPNREAALSKLARLATGPNDVPATSSQGGGSRNRGVSSSEGRGGGGGGGSPTVPVLTGCGAGGSTGSERFTAPVRQLDPPVINTSVGRKSVVVGTDGTRGTLSPSSERTCSGSVTRPNHPSQYPPVTQRPSSQQRQLNLNETPFRMDHPDHQIPGIDRAEQEEEEEVEEEEDYGEFREDDLVEEQDEVDAPDQVQDYEQVLDNLLHLPGRERLVRLSEYPIPNVTTIW